MWWVGWLDVDYCLVDMILVMILGKLKAFVLLEVIQFYMLLNPP